MWFLFHITVHTTRGLGDPRASLLADMTAKLSEHDKAHIEDILLGYGDWFSAQLMRLIAKADFENRAKLRLAFPDHVEAYEKWMRDHQ